MARGTINFQGAVAVITGAGSGIGRALAVRLAAKGAKLALSDIDMEGLEETRALCTGATALLTTLDVSDRKAVFDYADTVHAHFGAVNMVFNNAGVTVKGTVADVSIEDMEWLMGINFWGVVYGTKAFLPYLHQAEWGHIVNLSSIFGIVAIPSQSAYHAAKFAVRGFTESLRQELTKESARVSASCVHPGGVKTNIVRNMRTAGEREEANRSKTEARFDKGARTTPEEAAQIILDGVIADEPRILVGKDAKMLDAIQRLTPGRYADALRKLSF